MINYRTARDSDREAIDRLWALAFPEDGADDRCRFLDRVTLSDECVVATINEQTVSMAFLLPATLRCGERQKAVRYLYAAATDPSLRGQGVFAGLCAFAIDKARADGCAGVFLRPASERLARYYERLGFVPYFYAQTRTGDAALSDVAVTPITADQYVTKRRVFLPHTAVEWEPRFLSGAVQIGDGIALCDVRLEELYIAELLCPTEHIDEYAAALTHAYGCERYRCRVPEKEKQHAIGWLYPIGEIEKNKVPYMGVALD